MAHDLLDKETRDWLKARGMEACPACKGIRYAVGDAIQSAGPYVPVVCLECASTRFFSINHMGAK
jgi:hypothetical protein